MTARLLSFAKESGIRRSRRAIHKGKHDERFPEHAIRFCLNHSNTTANEVDYVAFYEETLPQVRSSMIRDLSSYAPKGFRSFCAAMPQWLKTKLHHPRVIRKALGKGFSKPILFVDHHMSPRGRRVLSGRFRESRDCHLRRGGRVGHDQYRYRRWQPHRDAQES